MGKLERAAMVVVLAGATTLACSGSTHPANLHVDGGGGGGGIVGAGGGSGVGGAAGSSCKPNPESGSTIEGNLILRDINFKDRVGFAGKAKVLAEGTPCGWAEATFDGAAPSPPDGGVNTFLLEGVKPLQLMWLHIYQEEGSTEDAYPTLNPRNASTDTFLLSEFGFYRKTQIDKVYSDAGITRDEVKGTLVVNIQSGLGGSISGVTVSSGTGQAAYMSATGGWQVGGSTDESGIAVILNVDAKPFPGTSVSVTLSYGSFEQLAPFSVEEGAVTLGLVVLTSFSP